MCKTHCKDSFIILNIWKGQIKILTDSIHSLLKRELQDFIILSRTKNFGSSQRMQRVITINCRKENADCQKKHEYGLTMSRPVRVQYYVNVEYCSSCILIYIILLSNKHSYLFTFTQQNVDCTVIKA